jgi:uncharacterized membrane protein
MPENNDKINQLLEKLEALLKRQDDFSRELFDLREEINKLKQLAVNEPFVEKEVDKTDPPETKPAFEAKKIPSQAAYERYQGKSTYEPPKYTAPNINRPPRIKSDIEKFIGENLITKIGIAILVIGVAIGTKYSIEHQLISPLTRIILGYLAGLGLLGFGIKLKKNYESYSAVLVSGSIAIMYFITYSAYTFYDLIPQIFAFVLMVVFTAFTIVAAIHYNRQVIAIIGMVGAYAVPFLLSEGSGKVTVLFSYMAIINVGVLLIAVKKYWKLLYNSSFILTWLIFLVRFSTKYETNVHFELTLIFLVLFFVVFYLMFLAYKLLQKEKFEKGDIILLLANSFIFYGIGYYTLKTHTTSEQFLGLFTLSNAIAHFGVSLIIYRQKLADRNLFYLVSGLVLIFITIAIPVQLSGNWITLLWACEAALLFWIGRANRVPFYEKLSYPILFLAFFSIAQDWITRYNHYDPERPCSRLTPLFNVNFLSSCIFIAAFTFINYINRTKLLVQDGNIKLLETIVP